LPFVSDLLEQISAPGTMNFSLKSLTIFTLLACNTSALPVKNSQVIYSHVAEAELKARYTERLLELERAMDHTRVQRRVVEGENQTDQGHSSHVGTWNRVKSQLDEIMTEVAGQVSQASDDTAATSDANITPRALEGINEAGAIAADEEACCGTERGHPAAWSIGGEHIAFKENPVRGWENMTPARSA
jgi:hypothetical protein